jgi:signal transduction histidine kinase
VTVRIANSATFAPHSGPTASSKLTTAVEQPTWADDRGKLEQNSLSIATALPSVGQRRLAIAVVLIVIAAFASLAPFATIPLARVDSFVPATQAIIMVTDLLTAVLLFNRLVAIYSHSVLVVANGYLFSALIVIPHSLSFPGGFSPTGLLGAGPQTTSWLFIFWHLGFATSVLAYAALNGANRNTPTLAKAARPVYWSVAINLSLVLALVVLTTIGGPYLPVLFLNELGFAPLMHILSAAMLTMVALTLALLWIRGRSVLDLWLAVTMCVLLAELSMITFLINGRFTLGYYSTRVFSVVVSTVVLIALLSESARLYHRLWQTNASLHRERENKLMSIEAVIAAMSHEIRQPLTAISANSEAGLLLAEQSPPDLEGLKEVLTAIGQDTQAASLIFSSIRLLFKPADQQLQDVNMNEIARSSIRLLRSEMTKHGVEAHFDIAADLPLVRGRAGQLKLVMVNLIQNAIDAMEEPTGRTKSIRIVTKRLGSGSVSVEVEDTGRGIESNKLDTVFDIFVSTKKEGMGLGLSLCRMIVEQHGGHISASSELARGTRFEFVLPVRSAASRPAGASGEMAHANA